MAALKPGQQKCINTLDRPLIVAAGAGSGKTFTLTQRIANAFVTGYVDDIDQILAITYTRKAAGELKGRIRSELRARGFHDQAMKVNDAWISTIHGMCLRILKTHAFELGLDPRMKLLTSAQSAEMLNEALDFALDNASTFIDDLSLNNLFREYPVRPSGYSSTSVEGLLSTLLHKADQDPLFFQNVHRIPTQANRLAALTELDELNRDYLAHVQAQKASNSQEGALQLSADALAVLDETTLSPVDQLSTRAFLEAVNRFPVPAANFGDKEFKTVAKDIKARMQAVVFEACLAEADQHLETLLKLAEAAFAKYEQLKRDAHGLTNGDLLNLAARALDDDRISALYSNKFKLVMVDEFQDTNQMQVDMIARLAGTQGERLCVVGDAQQSIYRFQGADVSVFRNHRANLAQACPDSVIVLQDNFRSHRDILSFVDRVFEQDEGFGSEFMSLAPGRVEKDEPSAFDSIPRIEVQLAVGAPRASRNEDTDAVAEDESALQARMIAERFSQLRESGSHASDMVILLGRMNKAELYADALRKQGFASVVARGSIFNNSLEAQTMVSLAQYLANPNNGEALLSLLTSELFITTADDLIWLSTGKDEQGEPCRRRLAKGMQRSWSPDMQDDLPATLACASSCLKRAVSTATRQSMSRAMMQVLVESGLLDRLEKAGAEGRAKVGNLYKAIRLMETVEQNEGLGPRSCAQWFEAEMSAAKESPGSLSASEGDFVRIVTIHSSKGLEFPIVAVADFENTSSQGSLVLYEGANGTTASLDLGNSKKGLKGLVDSCSKGVALEEDDESNLAAIIEGSPTPAIGRVAMQKLDSVASQAERVRLLYVALTRAREALIVSIKAKPLKDNPLGNPGPCAKLVRDALTHGQPFEEGARYSFGGTAAALFTCRHADVASTVAGSEPTNNDSDSANNDSETAYFENKTEEEKIVSGRMAKTLEVPAPFTGFPARSFPHKAAESGIESYSSLAHRPESKGLGLPCEFEVIGEPLPREPAKDNLESPASTECKRRWSEDEDGNLTSAQKHFEDDDKATDLGTAFHRLAQLAVSSAASGAALEKPALARIEAMARKQHLSDGSRDRLDKALDNWFGSNLCARTCNYDTRAAEAAFTMQLAQDSDLCLEGEMDLLCTSGNTALLVDYKTGGSFKESAETLRKKHLLQASCYANCLFKLGFESVEAVFVRVEQICEDGQPQLVVYRFDSSASGQFGNSLSAAANAIAESALEEDEFAGDND